MAEPTAPLHTRFDGWVMIWQHSPGKLVQTDIEAVDLDHQDAPLCDTGHDVARSAAYSLTSPEEASVLCGVCMLRLYEGCKKGEYLMGALPAN